MCYRQQYYPKFSLSNSTLKLEYLDPAEVSLPGINFMCVTSANRVLRGTSFRLTKADCSDGFLKIRALDNCDSSDDYFTIPVSVSGGYYAISINENIISFTCKPGTSINNGMNKLPAKAPTITNVKIYQSDGSQIFEQEYENVSSANISNLNLKPGEYTAIVTDGDYSQEIPFCI